MLTFYPNKNSPRQQVSLNREKTKIPSTFSGNGIFYDRDFGYSAKCYAAAFFQAS